MLELVCTSHSPLLLSVTPTERDQGRRFYDAIEKVHQFIVSYDPELIVLFAPDHFNGPLGQMRSMKRRPSTVNAGIEP